MGATKMLTNDMVPMIPGRFIEGGLNRAVKRAWRVSTNAYAPEPRSNPSGDFADELFFTTAGPAMLEIRSQAARMAGVDLPVLLVGGSAIVRDGVARLIHRLSPRCARAFAQVSCGGLSGDSLERKLFGSEVETPFGTTVAKPGLFEACRGGTVLLDGITAMPWRLQARLLDLLDEHQLCRADGRRWVNVDVRILASTSMDIEYALAAGKLREDLYYRLDSLALYLPPLGEGQEGTARTLPRSLANFGAEGDATLAALREGSRHIPGRGMSPS